MHGCGGAFSPGSTGGAARRICPAGHGVSSNTGCRFTGIGGGFTNAPFSAVFSWLPGHTYGAFNNPP